MDEIWEICTFPSGAYWVSKEVFEYVKKEMLTTDIRVGVVEFITLSGAEITLPLASISELAFTTLANRESTREHNKTQKELETKKEWETE